MVSPMCQYSAKDGCVSDWHVMHLGQFVVGGAGLIMVEMTNVEARGRISPYCVGLYNDANERALREVMDSCKSYAQTPIGIQLAHAGRKASTQPPWQGRKYISPNEGGWQPVAPSAIAGDSGQVPDKLSVQQIEQLVEAFANAAVRANRIGFDAVELHSAHGYLLHQFLSPLSNAREDRFGGAFENRIRFPLQVFNSVRKVWPDQKPIGVRVSATDWIDGGWTLDETVILATKLRDLGCDWIDVSSGGIIGHQDIKVGPGYQVHLSRVIRERVGIPTIAVGLITEPNQAEEIILKGDADVVALARGMLYNPRWAWHAAEQLGAEITYPNQYLRCQPNL